MELKEATIKDVAEQAKVSVGTVSRVINGAINIKEENRVKVEKAIRELGFRPNQYAKGLKNNKSNIIGIIVPNLLDEFYRYIVQKIEEIASGQGYLPVLLNSRDDIAAERRYIEFLWEKRADGIAIVASGNQNEDILLSMRQAGTAVIFIDRRPTNPVFDAVYADKKGAALVATNYFVRLGHQKIAMATGHRGLISSEDRFEGYVRALYDNNIQIQNTYIQFGSFSEDFGVYLANWWQGLPPEERPTAILLGSAIITYGFLCGAKQLGIRIPEDVSIISYGNIGLDFLVEPKITYMQQLSMQIAETAANLLFDRLKAPVHPTKQVALPVNLIEQATVQDLNIG